MSLQALLELESPTREGLLREIEEGFFKDLWRSHNKRKKDILKLITDDIIRDTAPILRSDLELHYNISFLDDVNSDDLAKSIYDMFGINSRNSPELKKRLVNLEIYSPRLKDYKNPNELCQKIID